MLKKILLCVAASALLWGAADSAASGTSQSWSKCGTVYQRARNGYQTRNLVEARDSYSCATARHVGLQFASGGYYYRGLTCFYAPMGSGDPYWSWSCGVGVRGDRYGPRDEVRGHLDVTKA